MTAKWPTWHFYKLDDGKLLGSSYSGPAEFLEVNTPVECGAYLEKAGKHVDHRQHRVQLLSKGGKRLVAHRPVEPRRAELIANVQAAIDAIEATLARPQRELTIAAAAGHPPPPGALQRVLEADSRINTLRAALARIKAAETHKALDTIEQKRS